MNRTFHETEGLRVSVLQPCEVITERVIDGHQHRIPSRVRCEPAVKQIEAAQILDDETIGEAISQFKCTEEVKPHSEATTVIQLDLALVPGVIMFEVTRFLNRIDEDRRRTADRAHGGDEMSPGHPRYLGGNFGQAGHRKMAQHTVEAQRDVN